jgi:hypothetical protein
MRRIRPNGADAFVPASIIRVFISTDSVSRGNATRLGIGHAAKWATRQANFPQENQ